MLEHHIIGHISIEERPLIVEKSTLGDWETDTIIGKGHQGVFVILAERVSKKTLVAAVSSKHTEVVKEAIIKLLEPEKEHLHTMAFDNGKELA